MSKVVTDGRYQELVRQGMQKQRGALCAVVGAMRVIPGCDEALMADAQAELARFRRGMHDFTIGAIKDFLPLDRELLARAWADWSVACGVKDYGWVDCRTIHLAMADGYSLV